jgi:hypothetical protein
MDADTLGHVPSLLDEREECWLRYLHPRGINEGFHSPIIWAAGAFQEFRLFIVRIISGNILFLSFVSINMPVFI